MDYFGRMLPHEFDVEVMGFQSFWVNGLLWKLMPVSENTLVGGRFQSFWVNGLLWKI